jgi:hypothetical protein
MAERGDWISFGDVSGISEGLALLPKCGDAQKSYFKGIIRHFLILVKLRKSVVDGLRGIRHAERTGVFLFIFHRKDF